MNDVVHHTFAASTWVPSDNPGLDYSVLRPHDGGGATIFLRFRKGSIGAKHTHPGGEEVYVVSGDITIGDKRMAAGDYLYTPPDGVHDAVAHEDTVLLVVLPKLPIFL